MILTNGSEGLGSADLLLEIELKIARRADEFAREVRRDSSLNLYCWLLAEAEVLGRQTDSESFASQLA
ncbi:MAG: hypothetical protein V4773_18830 [Verrucomicrobiota bacterium]